MRANDQVTTEYIVALETDNDHLRAELEVLKKEYNSLKARYELLIRDREAAV